MAVKKRDVEKEERQRHARMLAWETFCGEKNLRPVLLIALEVTGETPGRPNLLTSGPRMDLVPAMLRLVADQVEAKLVR
jgi:hypothetical protein